MSKTVVMTAAIVAAVVVLWVAAWPSRPVPATGFLDPDLQRHTITGAFHVHSTLSDGSGTRSGIAAAAARAGLRFVVFTDHGDGTRQPEAPSYASGVLCIDSVEISTDTGHYIALGLGAAPYRLGGEASAVVEDVRRLGGFGIVAHPDSPKPALAWRDWSAEADGVEWLNADSEWRNESWAGLGRTLLGYLARPAPALASMLDRESVTIDRWDDVTSRRRMAAFAALDAHGGPGRSKEEAGHLGLPRLPSYEASFSSFSMRAIVRTPLSGNAAADAPVLLEALRAGRTYTTLDAVASPPSLDFKGERDGQIAQMGETLPGVGPARLTARSSVADRSTLLILRNGRVVAEGTSGEVTTTTAGPGAYRVEVRLADRGSRAPWIFSNPIYVDLPMPGPSQPPPDLAEVVAVAPGAWHLERDSSTTAASVADGDLPGLEFGLGPSSVSPFAALAAQLPQPVPAFDAVVADVVSAAPARISVQLRSADGKARWRKSIYVGPGARPVVLRTSEFRSAEKDGGRFDRAAVASLLLVVDLVNAQPGASGRFFVRHLALAAVSPR
jgi:hypothetical protein